MAIKAIIFDCFGVLVTDGKGSLTVDFPDHARELHDLFMRGDYGYINSDELEQNITDLLGISLEDRRARYARDNVLNESVINWIRQLRAANEYKVGLLSNVRRGGLDDFLPHSLRDELFEQAVLSGEVGITKPAKEIFEIMADKLGVETFECIMIDDLMKNVDGAQHAGMHAVLYTHTQDAQAEVARIIEEQRA